MTLERCTDAGAADWIARSSLPWHQLVTFGPAGFAAYARLRLLPDPVRPGQCEADVEAEDWRIEQLPTLFVVLAAHTATADDCYAGIWDGWGHADPPDDALDMDADATPADRRVDQDPAARPGLAPGHGTGPVIRGAAKVVVPHRAYWLFRGSLTTIGTADTPPAFVWPADHGWCLTRDVDPHWVGIGGSVRLIRQLVADPRLDVVPADPTERQPCYR